MTDSDTPRVELPDTPGGEGGARVGEVKLLGRGKANRLLRQASVELDKLRRELAELSTLLERDQLERAVVEASKPDCVPLLGCSNCLPGDQDPSCREHSPIIEWLKARLHEELNR